MPVGFGRLTIEIMTRSGVRQWEVPLHAGANTIGHSDDNDVPLPDPSLSNPHAILEVGEDTVTLTNLDKRQGVRLGDAPLLASQPIHDGAIFTIGVYRLTYRATDPSVEADSDSAAVGDAEATRRMIWIDVAEALPPPRPSRPAMVVDPATSAFSRHAVESAVSRYLYDLPVVYHGAEHDFLGRFLKIFETIWEPMEWRQDHIAMYFDPHTCPAALLSWLEHWMGIDFSAHWPEGLRREVLAEIHNLYRWRGTANTLARAIRLYTRVWPKISSVELFVVEIDPQLPPDSDCERAVVELLIRIFKPAHIGYRLKWSEQP
jgi:phage tail-like protein